MAIDMFQQTGARERVGLIDFIANFREVCAAPDQFSGDVISAGTRARILEGARVSGDSSEKTISDRLGDRPFGNREEAEKQFARRGLACRDPIEVGVAGVALVVIDVNEELAVSDTRRNRTEALETGGIRGNHAIEFRAALRPLKEAVRVQKLVFLGNRIFVPANDLFALVLQGHSQTEL